MAVITDLTLPAGSFELGQILTIKGEAQITLETVVPLGERPIPFFRIYNDTRDAFERAVRDHSSVTGLELVNSHDGELLYALDWMASDASLVRTIHDLDGVLLSASGTADTWSLEIRFPTHGALSEFQAYYLEENIPVSIKHIYNPTRPEAGPWFGVTPAQREALTYAVESGYYSLPRGITTQKLGERFDISDQAVTERLRRGISTLVSNTLLVDPESD